MSVLCVHGQERPTGLPRSGRTPRACRHAGYRDEKYVQTFVREVELQEIYARADLGLVWRHAGVDPHTWVGVTAIGEVFVRSRTACRSRSRAARGSARPSGRGPGASAPSAAAGGRRRTRAAIPRTRRTSPTTSPRSSARSSTSRRSASWPSRPARLRSTCSTCSASSPRSTRTVSAPRPVPPAWPSNSPRSPHEHPPRAAARVRPPSRSKCAW